MCDYSCARLGFAVQNPATFRVFMLIALLCGFAGQTSRPVWAASVFFQKPDKVARWVLTADWKSRQCDAVDCAGFIFFLYVLLFGRRGRAATWAPVLALTNATLDLSALLAVATLAARFWYERYRQFKGVCRLAIAGAKTSAPVA